MRFCKYILIVSKLIVIGKFLKPYCHILNKFLLLCSFCALGYVFPVWILYVNVGSRWFDNLMEGVKKNNWIVQPPNSLNGNKWSICHETNSVWYGSYVKFAFLTDLFTFSFWPGYHYQLCIQGSHLSIITPPPTVGKYHVSMLYLSDIT